MFLIIKFTCYNFFGKKPKTQKIPLFRKPLVQSFPDNRSYTVLIAIDNNSKIYFPSNKTEKKKLPWQFFLTPNRNNMFADLKHSSLPPTCINFNKIYQLSNHNLKRTRLKHTNGSACLTSLTT